MNEKETKETTEILSIIAQVQEKTSPVEMKIGTTTESGYVVHGGVYIKECAGAVITALQKAGWVLSMDNGWLHPCYKGRSK